MQYIFVYKFNLERKVKATHVLFTCKEDMLPCFESALNIKCGLVQLLCRRAIDRHICSLKDLKTKLQVILFGVCVWGVLLYVEGETVVNNANQSHKYNSSAHKLKPL